MPPKPIIPLGQRYPREKSSEKQNYEDEDEFYVHVKELLRVATLIWRRVWFEEWWVHVKASHPRRLLAQDPGHCVPPFGHTCFPKWFSISPHTVYSTASSVPSSLVLISSKDRDSWASSLWWPRCNTVTMCLDFLEMGLSTESLKTSGCIADELQTSKEIETQLLLLYRIQQFLKCSIA